MYTIVRVKIQYVNNIDSIKVLYLYDEVLCSQYLDLLNIT